MSIGSAIGGVAGGIIGSIPTFGIGAPLGAAAGSALGGGVEAIVKSSQANKMQLTPTDIRQKILLDEIRQKRKALESGITVTPQMEAIQQMGTTAMNRATRATGGNIGALVNALRSINLSTGRGMNELYGQMTGQSMNMLGVQNELTQQMANRDFSTQMYNKAQAMGSSQKMMQDSTANILAFLARMKEKQERDSVLGLVPSGGVTQNNNNYGVGGNNIMDVLYQNKHMIPTLGRSLWGQQGGGIYDQMEIPTDIV